MYREVAQHGVITHGDIQGAGPIHGMDLPLTTSRFDPSSLQAMLLRGANEDTAQPEDWLPDVTTRTRVGDEHLVINLGDPEAWAGDWTGDWDATIAVAVALAVALAVSAASSLAVAAASSLSTSILGGCHSLTRFSNFLAVVSGALTILWHVPVGVQPMAVVLVSRGHDERKKEKWQRNMVCVCVNRCVGVGVRRRECAVVKLEM